MSTIRHLFDHIRVFRRKHRLLYVLCTMIIFWTIFEGIISYIVPLLIVERGISKTSMGLIIGISSLSGAFFDFLMSWLFKNAKHRRILIVMFAASLCLVAVLWKATAPALFFLAMVVWGLCFDLHNVSNFEFVGNHMSKSDHSSSFGLIAVANALGYLLAPILAGLVIGYLVDWKPFVLALIFLLISFVLFLILDLMSKKEREEDLALTERVKPINFLLSLSLWHRIGKLIAPLLFLTCLLNVIDSFFWTAGPLLAESFTKYHEFAGFFMAAFTLPPLLVGWTIGRVTARYGKKKTAFISFFVGSMVLASMFFFKNPILLTTVVLVASSAIAFSWPAINGVYADFISETDELNREVESIEDFFANIGYVIGPIAAGFLSDRFGNLNAFSIIGIVAAFFSLILLKITPHKIKVDKATEIPSHLAVINELSGDRAN